MNNQLRAIWQIPVAIALLTIFGLIFALMGEHLWRIATWFCIGAPLTYVLWLLFKRKIIQYFTCTNNKHKL